MHNNYNFFIFYVFVFCCIFSWMYLNKTTTTIKKNRQQVIDRCRAAYDDIMKMRNKMNE